MKPLISDAVSSARNLDWRNSACKDSRLQVPFEPCEVYNANVALSMGHTMWLTPEARHKVSDFLSQAGHAEVAECLLAERAFPDIALTASELETLNELQQKAGFSKLLSVRVVEEQLARDGYGVPAIALLILAIAVAVVVFVFAF